MGVINGSGWPTTKCLTLTNKAEFLNGLINQELLIKRRVQISAFGRGLELLGLLSCVRGHCEAMRDVFVHNPTSVIHAKDIFDMIESNRPFCDVKARAYVWFMDYIKDRDTSGMFAG